MKQSINGILLVDKTSGCTSNALLQKIKYLFNARKAGHTGSLDPIATGMLPICFGEATKFSQYLLDANKRYEVVAKLGEQTSTGDIEGKVINQCDIASIITLPYIKAAAACFLGEIEQLPPMFSAIKHNGQPLYKLARQGVEVERQLRKVAIFSLQFNSLKNNELTFDVVCSKGTYIRTLVEDIAKKINCYAHVIALRRSYVAPYQSNKMFTLTELERRFAETGREGLYSCLLPIETSLSHLPIIELCPSTSFYMRMGQAVRVSTQLTSPLVALVNDAKHFMGLGEVLADGRIKPHRLLNEVQNN